MAVVTTGYAIAGLGEVMWDFYGDEKFLGGMPANVICHVQQLGDQGLLVSRVGSNALGNELQDACAARGLATDFLQRDALKQTGRVHITLDAQGVPHYRGYRDVAFDYIAYTPRLEDLARRVDAVVFGTLAQRSATTRDTLFQFLQHAASALKVFDLGYAHADLGELARILPGSLEAADLVKMNIAELHALQQVLQRNAATVPELMTFLLRRYQLKLVAVTRGAQGCELYSPEGTCTIPGLPVQAIDTTGAGDAFTAGLLHNFLRRATMQECGEFANLLGAFLCTHKGATPRFDLHTLRNFEQSLQ